MAKKVMAFDFGASSGRALLGSFDGKKIATSEIHRFSNDPVMLGDTFYWDILRLFFEIKQGIGKAANSENRDIISMGIDTWGVDFGLLDRNGDLLQNPIHYRDLRNEKMPETLFKKIPKETVYNETGIQIMNFNTIFQLYHMVLNNPSLLEKAETMLLMPDLFNFFLTGNRVTEYSIASTTQLLNAEKGDWSYELIEKLGIPKRIFTPISDSGVKVGKLLPKLAKELNSESFDIFAVAGHDTGSAVAAVPAKKGENYAYLSCGTWSLLGLELDKPLINQDTYNYNFTNEGGYGRKIRFLKNIIGLWLMQESRRQWSREGCQMSFKDIDKLTAAAKPLQRFIDPNSDEFLAPGDMPGRIADFCKRTGQPVPQDKGEISLCITESLALKYREQIENLERLKGSKVDALHIIGGGVQDKMLCQFTANAIKKPVIAGPIEATALGNIAVQLIANGEFKNIDEARDSIRESFPTDIYEPKDTGAWDEAYNKFTKIKVSD